MHGNTRKIREKYAKNTRNYIEIHETVRKYMEINGNARKYIEIRVIAANDTEMNGSASYPRTKINANISIIVRKLITLAFFSGVLNIAR